MKVLIALAVITVALALYVVWLRPWMKTTAAGAAFLAKIEPMERALWWNSETILWSRFKVFMGTVLTVLVGVNWNAVAPILPADSREIVMALPTILLAIDGLIGEYLRKQTTKPLEIVAMRTDAPEEVKVAAAEAQAANAQVVEAAKEAGAV